MTIGLAYLNDVGNIFRLDDANDFSARDWYHRGMASLTRQWYAKEWLSHFGKKQASLVNDLDWNKARASLMVRGLQPYDRDSLNQLADYLNLEPFELLLPVDRAMSYRNLRASAEQIMTLTPEPTPPTVTDMHDVKYARSKSTPRRPTKTGTHR